jgi:hypothetical protein
LLRLAGFYEGLIECCCVARREVRIGAEASRILEPFVAAAIKMSLVGTPVNSRKFAAKVAVPAVFTWVEFQVKCRNSPAESGSVVS